MNYIMDFILRRLLKCIPSLKINLNLYFCHYTISQFLISPKLLKRDCTQVLHLNYNQEFKFLLFSKIVFFKVSNKLNLANALVILLSLSLSNYPQHFTQSPILNLNHFPVKAPLIPILLDLLLSHWLPFSNSLILSICPWPLLIQYQKSLKCKLRFVFVLFT